MEERAPAPAGPLYGVSAEAALGPGSLLSTPSYLRLWTAGAIGNGMRWLELLVAGIFTWQLTQSTFLVALVTVARTLPMLFLGTIAGLVADSLDRKRLLLLQLFAMAANSAVLALLAGLGWIEVWHIALGGAVAGIAWAAELAVRRRMIGECVAPGHVREAIALDTLTGSVTRVLGPLLGGAIFETLGLGGAYLLSAVLYGAAGIIIRGLEFHQEARPLVLSRIPADIAEGLAVARANPSIMTVVFVSIIANTFGFSYSSLVAPLGLHDYRVGPLLVGLLAAAEPLGAIAGGIAVSVGWTRLDGRRAMLRGTFLFFAGVIVMALSPWYALAFLVLCVAGLGSAAFSIMQTSLILIEAPPALRSRVMGIVTVCIGTGPFGVLAIGALSEWLGAPAAILIMAGTGLCGLALLRLRLG
jgi:MFS family permease